MPTGVGVMRFRVLGPVEAWAGDQRLALGGPRQVTLLTFLLLHTNRAVSADTVIDAVWGAERDGAVKRLQMAIARLRKALEPLEAGEGSVLRTVSGGYLLSLGPGELDAEVFAEQVRDGRRALAEGDPAGASEVLGRALALWRGPPLGEVAFEDFAQAEIRRLEEVRLSALETRIEADLHLGRHGELIGELEALLDEQPTRESFAGQLMIALYRSGRQTNALEVYQRTRSQLAEQLGLEPGPALSALQTQILEHSPALSGSAASTERPSGSRSDDRTAYQDHGIERHLAALPLPPTPTIGRRHEVETVSRLLADPEVRLVTLTGPGGVGKTRLALTVAHEVGVSFSDGARWVELAGVSRAEDVGSAVVRSLGLTPLDGESAVDTLRRGLANRRMLLVVDNFEHVLDAAGLLGDLQAASPGVATLTTSREPLNLAAEHRVSVSPLALPPVSKRVSAAKVEEAEASALFIAAVRRRNNEFKVGASSALAVARICAALDGLPLALELAAARTGLLTIQDLAERLVDTVGDLGAGPRDAPARQRTLQATIDWSYDLLDEDQKDAFVRFAVFAGGAALDAAQLVSGCSPETLEALIAKSLIDRRETPDGTARLVMLETVRATALERLASRPDRDAVHRQHLDYYLKLAERLTSRLATHDEPHALAALDSEADNLSAALRWALDAAPGAALRLAGRLGEYWYIRRYPDALFWLEVTLRAAGEDADPHDRALAHLRRAGQLREGGGERGKWNEADEEALRLYHQVADDAGLSLAYSSRAMGASKVGDVEGALRYAEAAVRHARIADDGALLGKVLSRLAIMLPAGEGGPLLDQAGELLRGAGAYRELAEGYLNAAYTSLIEDRVTEALSRLDVAMSVLPNVNNPATEMFVLGNLGLAQLFSGSLEEARTAFERQLRLCVGQSFRYGADEGLAGIAAVLAAEGRSESAATLRGAAAAMGYPHAGTDDVIADRLQREYFAPVQTACGITAWRQAEQAGSELSYEDAIAFALEQSQPRARPTQLR